MIPSGYKASKVYSVLPTDGTGDLTFSRAGALPLFNATRVNSDGLIEEVLSNVPRLNYPMIDGVVSGCPSLLLEPERTNQLTFSEQFDNAAWTKTNSTITANAETAPDGTLTAETMTIADGTSYIQQVTTLGAGTYTISCYVKVISTTTAGAMRFNLVVDGSVTNLFFTPTSDWQRFEATFTATIGVTTFRIREAAGGFVGTIAIWGAQLEAGSYATSYIPTVASTVTRVADVVSKTGLSSYINSQQGVLFFESKALANSGNFRAISLSDGTAFGGTTDAIEIQYSSTNDRILLKVTLNGSVIINIPYIITALQYNKFAFKWSNVGCAFFINGVKQNDYAAINFDVSSLTDLSFSLGNLISNRFIGKVKNLQVYPTALSDAQLIALTQ
jgi:hypothetical protein